MIYEWFINVFVNLIHIIIVIFARMTLENFFVFYCKLAYNIVNV